MNVYLLLPGPDKRPWSPWYDKCFGMVVVAPDEQTARELAASHGKDEVRRRKGDALNPWLSPTYSTAQVIATHADGEPRFVLQDVHSA